MNEQRRIGAALAARGYKSKFPSAHVVKAGLKLLEETAEYCRLLPLDSELLDLLERVERMAKQEFDERVAAGNNWCPIIGAWAEKQLPGELADVMVTVFDSANGLGLLDVVQAAVAKAEQDVTRGVRQ